MTIEGSQFFQLRRMLALANGETPNRCRNGQGRKVSPPKSHTIGNAGVKGPTTSSRARTEWGDVVALINDAQGLAARAGGKENLKDLVDALS